MNVHTMPPLGQPRAVRASKSRPRPVRPRFKQPAEAATEADAAALRRLRLEAEAAVEHLLAVLDALDGDADLEPAGDEREPSLCGLTADCGGYMGSSTSGLDFEADESNDEPSLGWTEDEAARGRFYAGSMGHNADLEEQCEDEGAREGVLV